MTKDEQIAELEAEVERIKKSKEIIINAAVPSELKVLVEDAVTALRSHTGEGKAILFTELSKRFDEVVNELRKGGYDKAIPNEKVMKAMAEGREEDAAEVFKNIANKMYWEGSSLILAVYSKYKSDMLIENE